MLIMTRDQLRYAGINPQTDGWTIPKNVQIFWEPVFSMIYENKVIGELLINLITRLGENIETASDSVTQLVCWTKMMLEPCLSSDIDIFSTAEWSRILHRMVAAPGHFDVTLIEAVMQKVPNMDKKRRKQVRRIMDISMSESLMVVEDSMNVRTIEDLQNLIHKGKWSSLITLLFLTSYIFSESQSSKEANGNEEDRFILCDMEEWCSVPIGLTPGQSLDSLSLIIDDDWLKEQGQLKPYGLVTIVEE
uniref:DUF5071 domain-containing protein n=1 Tax=Heterorhabditis bacteriophora TaxID=37862 RepID=A0A1I7XMN0_HETBA